MKTENRKPDGNTCQYYFPDLRKITLPDRRTAIPLRRIWWRFKKFAWHVSVLGPFKFTRRMLFFRVFGKRSSKRSGEGVLNLQPGELVEVRSEKEIFATLDHEGKLRGLAFNPEMREYCGRRFRVYKRLEKIILEATGELRTVKTPTVFLEGLTCNGEAHGGCDRSCFFFWREAWLRRIVPQNSKKRGNVDH